MAALAAGIVDPTKAGKYRVVLSDALLGREPKELYTGLRCRREASSDFVHGPANPTTDFRQPQAIALLAYGATPGTYETRRLDRFLCLLRTVLPG